MAGWMRLSGFTGSNCPCGLQYTGRTSRVLQVRINEHIANIIKGFKGHRLSTHLRMCHNRDPSSLKLLDIDTFSPNWRGNHQIWGISRLETQWIFTLKMFHLFGLNIKWDFNSFINNREMYCFAHVHFIHFFVLNTCRPPHIYTVGQWLLQAKSRT